MKHKTTKIMSTNHGLATRKNNSLSLSLSLSSCLVLATLVSGTILASTTAKADDSVVDDVNISVPISCSMTGTGNTSHNAEINNGTYEDDIGTTTFKVFCNDNEGFALYANGYTNQEDGNNVLINSALANNNTIATGTATSGDTSNWAMKLTKTGDSGDTTTAPLTIDNSFDDYNSVPTTYTKVAHKNASTDMAATGGATLQSTYAAYINSTQSAGTYSGKVKYVLVHPSTGDAPVNADQVGVTYNGNGLTFASGGSKNRVIYGPSCTPMYIATTPGISKTSNIDNDGVATGSFDGASGASYAETVTFSGADRLRVDMAYAVGEDDTWINVWAGSFDYDSEVYDSLYDYLQDVWPTDIGGYTGGAESDGAGGYTYTDGAPLTTSFYVEDESVTIMLANYNESNVGYGYYAQIYPIYSTEQSGTEETSICSGLTNITGTYTETTTWKGKWYITSNNETTFLENEAAVINYLEQNSALLGTNVNIYAYNPYTIIYNGNGASAGTMDGFTTKMEMTTSTANLMAPNFKRTGYGFAGWSEDSNATVNSSSKIYGPNEKVLGSDLNFNSSTHETTMYAVWVPTAGDMQSFSCSSLGSNQITALTDTRDNNVYTVGKMQDGNCWMMENLRLDNNATTPNWGDNNLSQGFGGVFTGLAASEDANFTNSTPANSLYSTSNITGSNQAYRFPRYNNNNTNIGGTNVAGTTLTVAPGRYDGSNLNGDTLGEKGDNYQWYGYGNYYTWAAAMANTTSMSSASASEAVSTSICPAGWSLPYGYNTGNGATSGGFSYLDKQTGGTGSNQYDNGGEEIVSNRWRSYPNNFIYSGYWSGSNAYVRGVTGRYWSRTASNTSYAFSLDFYSSNVNPGTNGSFKVNGYSVRCLSQ